MVAASLLALAPAAPAGAAPTIVIASGATAVSARLRLDPAPRKASE